MTWCKDEGEFRALNGYEIQGVWYPRVTRILEVKAKQGLEHFYREVGHYASAEDIKNKSAKEGSLTHDTAEKIAVGIAVDVPESIRPAMDAFEKFKDERKILFYPEFVERQIWSPRHRYAGTVDALASIDGKFGVLDIKTSSGFYPEYNLQTGAYASALQEFEVKRTLALPWDVGTRWILRIDQRRQCARCGATLREKGGRSKVRNGKGNGTLCPEETHEWGNVRGDVELREFPHIYRDIRAFLAAKILWEWENEYWLRKINYLGT